MKLDWKSVVGILLSGVVLWWTLRGVDFREVWQILRASNLLLFALCTVLATCIFPLRARRWRTILEPVAGVIPFGPLWRSTAIGMMVNNVFPFRAGEIARAFAITREVPRVALTTSIGSLAVDRIFDAIVLFALMFSAMLDPRFPRNVRVGEYSMSEIAVLGISVVAGALVMAYLVVLQHDRVIRMVGAFSRLVFPRLEAPVVRLVEHGVGGLAVLRDSRRFVGVLWWALAHWLVHALALYVGFLAIGLDVPFSAALFVQGVLGIGVSIPSSPGFFGIFEAAAVIGLGVYGVPREAAISWAIGYHILSYIPITVIGAIYFTRLGLGISEMKAQAEATA